MLVSIRFKLKICRLAKQLKPQMYDLIDFMPVYVSKVLEKAYSPSIKQYHPIRTDSLEQIIEIIPR